MAGRYAVLGQFAEPDDPGGPAGISVGWSVDPHASNGRVWGCGATAIGSPEQVMSQAASVVPPLR